MQYFRRLEIIQRHATTLLCVFIHIQTNSHIACSSVAQQSNTVLILCVVVLLAPEMCKKYGDEVILNMTD